MNIKKTNYPVKNMGHRSSESILKRMANNTVKDV